MLNIRAVSKNVCIKLGDDVIIHLTEVIVLLDIIILKEVFYGSINSSCNEH